MKDHELLEAAAKAMNGGAWHPLTHDTPNDAWNPLENDGDAFRLAVKLDFRIDVDRDIAWAAVMLPRHLNLDAVLQTDEKGDPYAATRRAIVRAAAEIGKSL